MIDKSKIKHRVSRKRLIGTRALLLTVAQVLAGTWALAQANCDPVNDFGCDEDLPLDSHVWVLILIVSIIALYALYNRRKAMP